MEQQKSLTYATILLAIAAGYCDTVTFISADNLFSAHVTGNFIVFAYDITRHAGSDAWLKLLSFPVFILAVMAGGLIASNFARPTSILLVEGGILTGIGIVSFILSQLGIGGHFWMGFIFAMCVVFAMGLQNAFGRIYGKETFGPTTVMTGNVTQAALEVEEILKNGKTDDDSRITLKRQGITISGFLIGCVTGAILGNAIGLSSVIFPGVAVSFYALRMIGSNPTTILTKSN
jgi:uncharacterized membrane protein YoaK (UPF0700 family)